MGWGSTNLSDLMHLLRADIVDGDYEDRLVSLQERFQLFEIGRLEILLVSYHEDADPAQLNLCYLVACFVPAPHIFLLRR